MSLPTRQEALEVLKEHVKDEYQVYHAQMVAKALESYAQKLGEDQDLWYITGLLHDLDYQQYPEEHPAKSIEWFESWNYPEDLIHAVKAHAYMTDHECQEEPKTKLAKALLATDEMCGIMHAYSLMRPEGYKGMEPKSVNKKFKDKAFAAKVDREIIKKGMELFGVEPSEHFQLLIDVFSK